MRHFFVGAAGEPGSSLEHSPLAARVAHPPAGGRADGHGRGAGTVRWHRAARSASRAPGAASGPTPRRSGWAGRASGWPAWRAQGRRSGRRIARGLRLARLRRQSLGRGHRAAHPHAGGRGNGKQGGCLLRRSDAAALAMGHVERRMAGGASWKGAAVGAAACRARLTTRTVPAPGARAWSSRRAAGYLTADERPRSCAASSPPIRAAHPHACGRGDAANGAAGITMREAPAKLLGCGPRRPDAAALAMGQVERRDGRWCIGEGARPPPQSIGFSVLNIRR